MRDDFEEDSVQVTLSRAMMQRLSNALNSVNAGHLGNSLTPMVKASSGVSLVVYGDRIRTNVAFWNKDGLTLSPGFYSNRPHQRIFRYVAKHVPTPYNVPRPLFHPDLYTSLQEWHSQETVIPPGVDVKALQLQGILDPEEWADYYMEKLHRGHAGLCHFIDNPSKRRRWFACSGFGEAEDSD